MKQRNPAAVFFLSIITLGIYSVVWSVKTKNEMKSLGADIPTAWLIIIPFVNYYWYWKYAQGVDKVTNKEMSAPLSFVLLILLSFIGMAIVQSEFNKVAAAPVAGAPAPGISGLPASQPAVPMPDSNFGGPAAPQAVSSVPPGSGASVPPSADSDVGGSGSGQFTPPSATPPQV